MLTFSSFNFSAPSITFAALFRRRKTDGVGAPSKPKSTVCTLSAYGAAPLPKLASTSPCKLKCSTVAAPVLTVESDPILTSAFEPAHTNPCSSVGTRKASPTVASTSDVAFALPSTSLKHLPANLVCDRPTPLVDSTHSSPALSDRSSVGSAPPSPLFDSVPCFELTCSEDEQEDLTLDAVEQPLVGLGIALSDSALDSVACSVSVSAASEIEEAAALLPTSKGNEPLCPFAELDALLGELFFAVPVEPEADEPSVDSKRVAEPVKQFCAELAGVELCSALSSYSDTDEENGDEYDDDAEERSRFDLDSLADLSLDASSPSDLPCRLPCSLPCNLRLVPSPIRTLERLDEEDESCDLGVLAHILHLPGAENLLSTPPPADLSSSLFIHSTPVPSIVVEDLCNLTAPIVDLAFSLVDEEDEWEDLVFLASSYSQASTPLRGDLRTETLSTGGECWRADQDDGFERVKAAPILLASKTPVVSSPPLAFSALLHLASSVEPLIATAAPFPLVPRAPSSSASSLDFPTSISPPTTFRALVNLAKDVELLTSNPAPFSLLSRSTSFAASSFHALFSSYTAAEDLLAVPSPFEDELDELSWALDCDEDADEGYFSAPSICGSDE
ncbi:hypothetical protein JCM10213_007483 [Rhodosporidiobolus nylandii]